MTTKLASMLKVGDLVMDHRDVPRSGEVIRKRFFGLTVLWRDGSREKLLFGKMRSIRLLRVS